MEIGFDEIQELKYLHIEVLSLPKFRHLLEVQLENDFTRLERILRTVQFSSGGFGIYLLNQNQVRRSTYVSQR